MDVIDDRYVCRDCRGPLRFDGLMFRCLNADWGVVDCGGRKPPPKQRPKVVHKLACRAGHVIKVRRGEPTPRTCAEEVPRGTQLVGGARVFKPGEPTTVACGLPLHSKGWQSR